MKSLIMWALLILLPYLTMAQCDCQVDSVPCFLTLAKEFGIEPSVSNTAQEHINWKDYQQKLISVYGSYCEGSMSKIIGIKRHKKSIHMIIDNRPQAAFTVAEKVEWSWGGVFYYVDFKMVDQNWFQSVAGFK